jgi:hypothetical protein
MVWLAALALAVLELMPRRPFMFTLVLAFLGALYVGACYVKGEPLPADRGQTRK